MKFIKVKRINSMAQKILFSLKFQEVEWKEFQYLF